LLILVGDPEVLGKDPLWRTFLNYIRLRKGSTGKEPSWKANETNLMPAQETIPRREGVVYGEEFIDKKSESIYRYDLSED
jgi:helicase MOV-10